MPQTDPIVVEFTAAPEYVAVIRRVAEAVGARAGLPEPQREDLQIAVSEVCNRLVVALPAGGEEHPVLRVRFWWETERIVVEIGGSGPRVSGALRHLAQEQFVSFVMRRLVDRWAFTHQGGRMFLRLEKARTERACLDNGSGVCV